MAGMMPVRRAGSECSGRATDGEVRDGGSGARPTSQRTPRPASTLVIVDDAGNARTMAVLE